MNKVDLTLVSGVSFERAGAVFKEDGVTEFDISGWTIRGTVILDKDNSALDKLITGSFVTDGTDGLYKIAISDVDRDAILALYPQKEGVAYELLATFLNGTGDYLARGTLFLENTRELSKKP